MRRCLQRSKYDWKKDVIDVGDAVIATDGVECIMETRLVYSSLCINDHLKCCSTTYDRHFVHGKASIEGTSGVVAAAKACFYPVLAG